MKVVLVLAVLVAVAAARPDGEDHYDEKYDDFDVDSLISNPRLLKTYTLCFLGKGNCTPDGNKFKKILPEAIETTCGKCTPKQRVLVRKMIKAVQEQFPEEWKLLKQEYDPEEKYKQSMEKFLSESD